MQLNCRQQQREKNFFFFVLHNGGNHTPSICKKKGGIPHLSLLPMLSNLRPTKETIFSYYFFLEEKTKQQQIRGVLVQEEMGEKTEITCKTSSLVIGHLFFLKRGSLGGNHDNIHDMKITITSTKHSA